MARAASNGTTKRGSMPITCCGDPLSDRDLRSRSAVDWRADMLDDPSVAARALRVGTFVAGMTWVAPVVKPIALTAGAAEATSSVPLDAQGESNALRRERTTALRHWAVLPGEQRRRVGSAAGLGGGYGWT